MILSYKGFWNYWVAYSLAIYLEIQLLVIWKGTCVLAIGRQGLLVSKGFLETGENTVSASKGLTSDLHLKGILHFGMPSATFLWFLLGARTYRIQDCHPDQAPEFRPQCFLLRIAWDWASKIKLMCWFEVNLLFCTKKEFRTLGFLGPQGQFSVLWVQVIWLLWSLASDGGLRASSKRLYFARSPPLPCPLATLDQLPCSFHRLWLCQADFWRWLCLSPSRLSRMLLLDVHQPFWSRSLLPMIDMLILSWVSLRPC